MHKKLRSFPPAEQTSHLVITCPDNLLEESVIYQDIFKKGEKRGVQEGKRKLARQLLEQRFGKLPPGVQRQIESLAVAQFEELCEVLLEFQARREMLAWFKRQAVKN